MFSKNIDCAFMRKFIYRMVSALMAVMVLLSTMSFTVKKQYCGGFLVGVSFVGDVGSFDVSENSGTTVKMKNCCKEEVHHIEGQDTLQNESSNNLTFEQKKVLLALPISYNFIFIEFKEEKQFSRAIRPPELNQDLQVLYQTFLT